MSFSLRPSEATEGNIPLNKVLEITKARVVKNEVPPKEGMPALAPSCAVAFRYRDDEGIEYPEDKDKYYYHNVGSWERFIASEDGTHVMALNNATMNKNSGFYKWVTEAVNVGFPENKIGDDVTVFEGFRFYAVGKHLGQKTGAGAFQHPVPSKLIRLPGESQDSGKSPNATESSNGTSSETVDNTANLAELVGMVTAKLTNGTESMTRQDLAQMVIKEKQTQGNMASLASLVFSGDLTGALKESGFSLDGETITKAS